MHDQNFTTAFTVDCTPEEAFAAINDVRGWWSEDIKGRTEKAGDIFNYRYKDIHRCTIKIKASVPGERVVWNVVDNYFNFTEDRTEWKGTDIVFDISKKGGKTELRFTHVGLIPEYECFDVCSDGWTTYVNGSLRSLIATGKGQPNVGEPMNESERALAL
ncbi:SRPBCC domain-containing protein [Mesorhizobium sp. KR9-304]|uniref:SRPBCC family protein n=1 Tax=Mesorhizobium sp. KR9-304 TaxID=3156614 RepID=UPI0032B4AB65